MEYRIEKDTMGEVKVPAESLWGAQTERAATISRLVKKLCRLRLFVPLPN